MRISKKHKGILALIIVIMMSLNSFAAVVSDNDGSAFITKAEFDSMRNDFQTEINNFNQNIDTKLSSIIASYISGVKETKTDKLKLDDKSKYLFPLVMCGPNNEWNNIDNADYFDLSVPYFDVYNIATSADRSNSDDGTGDHDAYAVYTSLPMNVPLPTTAHLNLGLTCRIRHNVEDWHYDGRVGTINTLTKTTNTRKINGTNRYLFELVQRGRGQYNAYTRSSGGVGVFWDGNAENNTKGKWNYPRFIGLNKSNFKNDSSGLLAWNVASGTKPAVYDWTRAGVSYCQFMNGNRTYYFSLDGCTTVQQALNVIRSQADPGVSFYEYEFGGFMGNPYLVLPNWEHTNGTNTCYYGTANMQGNLTSAYWKYTPVQGTSASTQKISQAFNTTNMSRSKYIAYNFSGTAFSSYSGVLSNNPTCIPYWRAADNNSFLEQTSNDFSQLRASLVYYFDSDDKPHFCDEGMYLGRYKRRDATVEFTLEFQDADDWGVDVALSKKPFGYDAVNSNRIRYKYKLDGSPTATEYTCAAGSTARMQCNKKWRVKIEGIQRDDELYMQWAPATAGHYVALKSFTDYQITGT